ncbi:hypothetical protein B296_00037842 [Ensete ventricosum]|uniref:Uncharacterized protein n=1 Tax=Ensete ventricosum TaxID=4639 RepID=A0A426YB16_ENSVE|nr:hypothetical protein B296_00037842 [Ensete ventricosum]
MVGRSVAMQRQEWAGQAMEKGERSVERERKARLRLCASHSVLAVDSLGPIMLEVGGTNQKLRWKRTHTHVDKSKARAKAWEKKL